MSSGNSKQGAYLRASFEVGCWEIGEHNRGSGTVITQNYIKYLSTSWLY